MSVRRGEVGKNQIAPPSKSPERMRNSQFEISGDLAATRMPSRSRLRMYGMNDEAKAGDTATSRT